MTDLTLLIARLSAATEGSRELDAEIANAVDACPSLLEGLGPMRAGFVGAASGWDYEAEEYTTSIDAALTLVPPKYGISLCGPVSGVWNTDAIGPSAGKVCDFNCDHFCPAIGLTIVLLRARQAVGL